MFCLELFFFWFLDSGAEDNPRCSHSADSIENSIFPNAIIKLLILLIFGTSIWLSQCMTFIHSAKKDQKLKKHFTNETPWIMNLQVRMIESSRHHHYGETWPRSSTYSTRAPKADLTWPWFEPTTSCTAGEHSSKELLQQLMLLIFGSSTWLPQCMALMHSTRSKSSNSTYKWHTLNINLFESRRCHHYGETWQRLSPYSTRATQTEMSGPGLNLQPHALLPSTLAKSYCNSFYVIDIRNLYTVHGCPMQCMALIEWQSSNL